MKKYKIIITFLVLLVLIIGCKKNKTENGIDNKEKKESKKITVAYVGAAKTLDPQNTIDKRSIEVMAQIYNTLVEVDENIEIKPGIAYKWEKIDSLTTRFYIRDGIKFHNGDKLTIEDIEFSLNRMKESNIVSVMAEPIDKIKIIDKLTIDVITKYPYAPILLNLGDYSASIVNKKVALEKGKDFGNYPIGTGPFKFQDWSNRDLLKLVKNKDYFKGEVEIDELVFRAIPEASLRVIALETGEVDVAYTITPIDVPTVKENKKLDVLTKSPAAIEFIGFNTGKGVLTNKDLRKAIIYALNPEVILNSIFSSYGTNINSPIAPGAVGYSEEREIYSQNLEKAREHLIKSGYKDGLTLIMTYHSNDVSSQIAQIMQSQLKEIGIDLKVNPLEWGAFINYTSNGEQELFHLGKTSPTNDASEALSIFQSNLIGGGGNRFFYSNPKLDKILDLAKKEINLEKRKKYYKEAVDIIQDDGVMAFSFTREVIVGINKNIKDFKVSSTGVNRFEKVKKELK